MINGLEVLSCYCLVIDLHLFITPNYLGDFRQCLPVIPHASRSQIVAATISNSIFWKDVTIMHLSVNMRISQ